MTESTAEAVTLTPDEVRAAQKMYQRIYKAFMQMWTALDIIDGCRTGKLSAADHDEVQDMALAQGLQLASEASENDLTGFGYILQKHLDEHRCCFGRANYARGDFDDFPKGVAHCSVLAGVVADQFLDGIIIHRALPLGWSHVRSKSRDTRVRRLRHGQTIQR